MSQPEEQSATRLKDAVPFFDLRLQTERLRSRFMEVTEELFKSGAFIGGAAVSDFEEAFAEYCSTKYCVSLHSGTAALHLALMALELEPGSEVITAPNSFIATAEGISFAGCKPVFVDADESTFNIDPDLIERAITPRTKAIIPVHLYGQPAPMDRILEIARKHNLAVIEDACQAHGAELHGRRAGSFGTMACFSFYPSKNLGAAGDGGAVVTSDEKLAERLRLLRNHGSKVKYYHDILGHNFRLDALQCAILRIKLAELNRWNNQRIEIAWYYKAKLADVPGIIVPETMDGAKHVFHLYVVRVKDRARVQQVFANHGIQSAIHYPVPIHRQPAYTHLGLLEGSFPVTERMTESIISLPMFPELTREQQDRVIEALREAGEASRL